MNNKRSYIEPKDAPAGVPCRFCDIPADMEGKNGVYQDGVAVDGKRPLYSHIDCLMESGGLKQDNQDFSLQSLLPKRLLSPHQDTNPNLVHSAFVEEENIWAFASKIRYAHEGDEPNGLTEVPDIENQPKVDPMSETQTKGKYEKDDPAAPIPPSR